MKISTDNEVLDVSALPTYGYSHRSLMWWGTWGMMLIEATAFVMAIGSYLFLRSHAEVWPMSRLPPDLLFGSINVAILLVSCLPNHWVKQAFPLLTILMFTGPLEGVRFVDVSENAMYWYFVAFTWLPIYAVIYLLPRVLVQ